MRRLTSGVPSGPCQAMGVVRATSAPGRTQASRKAGDFLGQGLQLLRDEAPAFPSLLSGLAVFP